MEDITVVSDLAWIPRGVAKLEPIKLQMKKNQLTELLQGDNAESDEEHSAMENDKVEKQDEGTDETEKEGNMMKGVAMYADSKDDPYLTKHEDSEDEAEKDDFLLRPNDNLLAVAKMLHDEPTLDVYVFNKENDDWYVHHSYYLSSPPLCVTPIQHDPGSETGKGNLLAVGSFEPTIDIWDLDIYNALEPIVVLGKQASSKRKKRDNSAQGHSDAVTCLDWNKQCQHILASGSADQTVVLWDLDERKPSTIISLFDEKLASIKWHPVEEALLLTGTKSGKAQIIDCRNVAPTCSATWDLKAEIERSIWNIHNPFCFFVTTDDGNLHYLDSRQPGTPVASILAHEGGCNAVAQNPQIHGMIATVGENELKIWKLTSEGPEFEPVHTYDVKMGKLFTVAFNPDVHNTLVVGGASAELTRLFDIEESTEVRSAFETVFEDVSMVED